MVDPLDPPPPCIVCGAEGGNCGPEGDHPDHVVFHEWGGEDRPTPTSRLKKEPVTMANAVVATERIHERTTIPRSSRTRKVLRYAPGQTVPAADVERLNVKADGTQGKVPETDVAPDSAIPLAAKKAAAKKAPAKKAAARKTTAKKATPRKKAAAKKAAPRR